jgi:hypothetical protein
MVSYVTSPWSVWALFLLWTSVWWAEFLFCGWTELTFVETSIVYHQQNCLECIFSWFSLFWENKNSLMMSSFCASLNPHPPHQFLMPQPVFMKRDTYITPEPISTAYFFSPTQQTVCLYVYPSYLCEAKALQCIPFFTVRQRLGKQISTTMNTRNNWRIVGRLCLWICLGIPLALLGNGSIIILPRKRIQTQQ